jgi:hypothetical protein
MSGISLTTLHYQPYVAIALGTALGLYLSGAPGSYSPFSTTFLWSTAYPALGGIAGLYAYNMYSSTAVPNPK